MRRIFYKTKDQDGYAILFTVVIVSAISVITAGLTNAAYKQLVLSSLAKDSQTAFYQADTAGDCALYADRKEAFKTPPNIFTTGSFTCGGVDLNVSGAANGDYTISPASGVSTSTDPCFRIDVDKDTVSVAPLVKTTISARGYNICNTSNSRTVEREIEINYTE